MKKTEEILKKWYNPLHGIDDVALMKITEAMKEFATEVAKESLKNASEGFSEWLVCKNVEDSHKKQIISENNIPKLD